ncbi:MAG TPA: glutaredoxin [Clostridiales bacterium]|nr:glutaredoxin [Clostridiales bacterium]
MKEITYFYLPYCPYCQQSSAWLEELKQENQIYNDIPMKRVDESKETELANSYDYQLVPTFYIGDEKVHEGVATKEIVKAVLDKAMA